MVAENAAQCIRRPVALPEFISRTLFPFTFVAALFCALAGIERGLPEEVLVGGISLASIAIVALFERILPEHPEWNRSQDDVNTDLIHLLVSMVMIPKSLQIALHVVCLGAAVRLSELAGTSLWPSDWPLLAQLIPALLISQFFEYWAHRSLHEVPLLWRLHATHHSPGRLYWLNAARFHPLDAGLLFVVGLAPLLLLGAGREVLVLFTVWMSVHGMFQHCNIRLRLGPLNYLFSMAELHRWHHSLIAAEANSNYGNNILLWDLVFGTAHYPKDRSASPTIGLRDQPNFPTSWLGQVLWPINESTRFRPRLHGDESATPPEPK